MSNRATRDAKGQPSKDQPKVQPKTVATKDQPKTTLKAAQPPKVVVPKVDPTEAAVAKYLEFGWTVIRAPRESLNDIIAQKDKKLHYVQVVTQETIDSPKHTGIAKNTFIQNAFSNCAAPIYAHVITHGGKTKVTFENVNENARVIVGGRKAATVK